MLQAFDWRSWTTPLFICANCEECNENGASPEVVYVQQISFDQTRSPDGKTHQKDNMAYVSITPLEGEDVGTWPAPFTPRQRDLHSQLELPELEYYPSPPGCEPGEAEDEQRRQLLDLLRNFAIELIRGTFFKQMMADRTYADIHCQLTEDLLIFKCDRCDGRIIEFPLSNVSKIYRLMKVSGRWIRADTKNEHALRDAGVEPDGEHLIVVVFSRRKLAFMFAELRQCLRFLLCMQLLIWRAQQKRGLPVLCPPTAPAPVKDEDGYVSV